MKTTVNGFTMAYDDVGSGPAVVLIHGFPLTRRMWRHQARALVEAGYRVVLPDLRGFGESEASAGPYSMSVFADDILGLMNHLGIDKAAIAGMSMGGYILFDLLERHPGRISAVGFISTRAAADDETGKARRTRLAHSVEESGSQEVVDGFAGILFAEDTKIRRPELVAEVRQWMEAASRRGLAGALLAMRDRKDYNAFLATIDLPALILRGEDDRLIPQAETEAMQQVLPRASLCAIPGGGHMVNLEQPEAFNACLAGFLQTALTPRSSAGAAGGLE
jgi:3-oxoadipate enol-lactonase